MEDAFYNRENEELIAIVADYIGVPADAVRRDYYIVQMMQNLQNSEYAEVCVFKGGTSLSKCYNVCYEPVTGAHVGPGTVALFFPGTEK